MTENLTDKFLDSLPTLSEPKLPSNVVHQVKRCLLDYLGVTLAGSRMLAAKCEELLAFYGETGGSASVIGMKRRVSVSNAAFVNGLSAHVAELDDGVNTGIVHPGAPVFSALLALAEKEKIAAIDFIKGVVVGYEATVRMADAIQPFHKRRGYHATGTCGALGASIGLAAMRGFSRVQTKHALSAAAIAAGGTLKALDDASQLKPYNVGRAALIGIQSIAMAQAGFLGPNDVLSGGNGFLSVMTDKSNLQHWTKQHDDALAVQRVYIKPYAACRYCHPAIEAALALYSSVALAADEIASITVSTYQLAVTNHDHIDVSGVSSAKMSIPYSVAVALVAGRAGLSEFTSEWISHPQVTSLIKRIKVIPDERLTSLFPVRCCAQLDVIDQGGGVHSMRIDHPKGEPENPLSDVELERKFADLAVYSGKTAQEVRAIIDAVWGIADSLDELYSNL